MRQQPAAVRAALPDISSDQSVNEPNARFMHLNAFSGYVGFSERHFEVEPSPLEICPQAAKLSDDPDIWWGSSRTGWGWRKPGASDVANGYGFNGYLEVGTFLDDTEQNWLYGSRIRLIHASVSIHMELGIHLRILGQSECVDIGIERNSVKTFDGYTDRKGILKESRI